MKDTWYEVFVNTREGEGTRTIFSTDSKDEAANYAWAYTKEHPKESVYIDRWEKDDRGVPIPVENIIWRECTYIYCPNCETNLRIIERVDTTIQQIMYNLRSRKYELSVDKDSRLEYICSECGSPLFLNDEDLSKLP